MDAGETERARVILAEALEDRVLPDDEANRTRGYAEVLQARLDALPAAQVAPDTSPGGE